MFGCKKVSEENIWAHLGFNDKKAFPFLGQF
jgi:hypothetical protein